MRATHWIQPLLNHLGGGGPSNLHAVAPVLLLLLCVTPTLRGEEKVHLTREQAIERALPGATRIESATWIPTEEDCAQFQKQRVKVPAQAHTLLRGFDKRDKLIGYAMFVDEIGKFRPISFVVALDKKLKTRDVAVCVYRESHGAEITRKRFMKQFRGKKLGDSMRLGRDIIHISGATLSCRSTIRAVGRVLAVVHSRHDRKTGWGDLVFSPDGGGNTDLGRLKSEGISAGPITTKRIAMGTALEISVDAPVAIARPAIDAAFAEVERLTTLLDGRREASDIARILAVAPGEWVEVDPATVTCLARALDVAKSSGGTFDPTLVAEGFQQIEIDRHRVRRGAAVTRIDLGGIGKGFALDRAAAILRERGAPRALLNFGGQILALEAPLGRDGWTVAIAHPDGQGGLVELEHLAETSLACSGKQYRGEHIIDPVTGKPAPALGLTVVYADDATTADAWSTACAVRPALISDAVDRDTRLQRVGTWRVEGAKLASEPVGERR